MASAAPPWARPRRSPGARRRGCLPTGAPEGGYTLRTFQRDKQEIIDLFGLTIRHRRGQDYYLAETELLPAEHERRLEAVELQTFLRLPPALGQFVQPEARRPQGLEHLKVLAPAGLRHWLQGQHAEASRPLPALAT